MKILPSFLFFLLLTFTASPQETSYAGFPVTTTSPEALQHYYNGIQSLTKAQFYESFDNFNKALKLDPEFFMVNYIFAMFNIDRPDRKPFLALADKAVHSKNSLNQSEKLLQQALVQLMEKPNADVTEYGKKLVNLNPKSYFALSLLAGLQLNTKDYKSAEDTYQAILRLSQYPALVFDAIGKNYMRMNQMDKARQAFDQYLKAEPANANAYNSMGNYYAQLEDYQTAYEYYMKAYKLDSIQYKHPDKKEMKGKPDMTNF